MTILITGGAGFLGCHLTKRLLEAEQEVVIFDIDVNKIEEKTEGMILEQGDVSDIKRVEEIFAKYEFTDVFHLAAILPPVTEEDPYKAFKINVEGLMNVLKTASNSKVKTLIYPSSATVFGPDRKPPITADDILHPWTVYSSFKVCTEIIGSIYAKNYDINFRAVRFPIVVGPGRKPSLGITPYPTQMVEESVKGKPYTAEIPPDMELPIINVCKE